MAALRNINMLRLPEEFNKKYQMTKYKLPQIRVKHGKGTKKTGPYLLVRCGDCQEGQFKIFYHDTELHGDEEILLEIGGVFGDVDNWREILCPILGINLENGFPQNETWYNVYKNKQKLNKSKIPMRR